ncbi:hypothetical protein H0H92_002487 [Tricholoma furcatifolium]|nr:hypothetical protein H0H92_002487 [Tricholoma furcatifolium]
MYYQPISSELAEERVSNVYDPLATQILDMGIASLGNATYGTDFVSKVEEWSKNVVYRDAGDTNTEFRCNIFGQVATEECGTIIAAKGNYYAGKSGDKFVPLSDDSRVKDVLVLETPTFAGGHLERIFLNQIGSLNDILTKEEADDNSNGTPMDSREWVRNAANDKNNPANMIVLHMLRKYDNPVKNVKRLGKQSLDTVSSKPSPVADDIPSVAQITNEEPAVVKGGFYDPRLNADFRGAYFNLVRNKLVQLDVFDCDNKLVAPWKYFDALKPGTLILANCSLHCFFVRNGKGEPRKASTLILLVRILDESDGPPIPQVVPFVPGNIKKSKNNVVVNKPATDAFANFTLVKRKAQGMASGSGSSTASESESKRQKRERGSENKKKDKTDKGKKSATAADDFAMEE